MEDNAQQVLNQVTFSKGDTVKFIGKVFSEVEKPLLGRVGTVQYVGTRINVTFAGIDDDDIWFRRSELEKVA